MTKQSGDAKNVWEAMQNLSAELGPVIKSQTNSEYGYKYATEKDWYNEVGRRLPDHNLVLTVAVSDVQDIGLTPSGKQRITRVKVVGTLHHTTSGTSISAVSYGDGADSGDKAIYKAITGAKKYLYAMLFCLPTTDDPEADPETDRLERTATAQPVRQTKMVRPSDIVRRPEPKSPEPQSNQEIIEKAMSAVKNASTLSRITRVIEYVLTLQDKGLTADQMYTIYEASYKRLKELAELSVSDGTAPMLKKQVEDCKWIEADHKEEVLSILGQA